MRSWRIKIAIPILVLKDWEKVKQRLTDLLKKYMETKK